MIESVCPDCGSPGIRNSWGWLFKNMRAHKFLCTNLTCTRAQDPWFILESSSSKRTSLRDVVVFSLMGIYVVLGGMLGNLARRARKVPRRLLRWVWSKSKFADPRWIRVNGQWIHVDQYNDMMGRLEELQEATR